MDYSRMGVPVALEAIEAVALQGGVEGETGARVRDR